MNGGQVDGPPLDEAGGVEGEVAVTRGQQGRERSQRDSFGALTESSGDFERPAPQKIPPFDHAIIVAVSDTFAKRAVGDLHFRGRDATLFLDYSNPLIGPNDLDATITGPRASEFRWATAAGPGNKSAMFRCAVWHDWQDEWHFCPKCRGLFTPGIGSRCPAGGPHDPLGWNYILLHDVPDGPHLQAGWRFCAKCRGLFAEADGNGTCPAGGPHDPLGWPYLMGYATPKS